MSPDHMCNSYMRDPAPNPLVLSRDAAPSAWMSSDKSKESLVCTHRGTSAVRVLIELTRCSRAHAAATWRWCCGSCACTPMVPGGFACTTVMGSKDLGAWIHVAARTGCPCVRLSIRKVRAIARSLWKRAKPPVRDDRESEGFS